MGGLSKAEVQVHKFTADQRYGMRLIHIPTGVTIEGNCGWADRYPQLEQELMGLLETAAANAPLLPAKRMISRNDILEEAAQVAESHIPRSQTEKDQTYVALIRSIAHSIRLRKEQ